MNNLINELTLYSSIDNNRIPYNFVKINVAEYFGDCIEEIGADLESKSVKLNYSNLTTPDTQIVADPEQIKRVINNVVNNQGQFGVNFCPVCGRPSNGNNFCPGCGYKLK